MTFAGMKLTQFGWPLVKFYSILDSTKQHRLFLQAAYSHSNSWVMISTLNPSFPEIQREQINSLYLSFANEKL